MEYKRERDRKIRPYPVKLDIYNEHVLKTGASLARANSMSEGVTMWGHRGLMRHILAIVCHSVHTQRP